MGSSHAAQIPPPVILVHMLNIIKLLSLNHRIPGVTSNPYPACRQGMEEGIQEG